MFAPVAFTEGGGGTTSCVPKILPMTLLRSELFPVCEGGGGTTVRAGSAELAPSRRMSELMSVDGGGATTEGAGKVTLEFRAPARSGAETGGGTTAESICTGAEEIWRLTVPGAGGMTLAASCGFARNGSRGTVGAGATTLALSDGALEVRSRTTFGAGGTTVGASAGATSV